MKKSKTKAVAAEPSPVFDMVIRQRGAKAKAPAKGKREKTFSKSRDTREDRGTRQMKNSANPTR